MDFTKLIPIITAIIAVLSSVITSKITTKSELKKILSQQKHELELNEIQAFAKMNNAINVYISTPTLKFRREALAAVGEFLPYASEKILIICNSLENALNSNQHNSVYDLIIRLRDEWLAEQEAKKNHQ